MMTPRVADISHHNTVTDLKAAAAAGLWGIIHKASQGRSYRDPNYSERRDLAKAVRLLWGAYHFNTGDTVKAQVDNFIAAAKPDANTLMVLDYEDNRLSNMNILQVVEFLRRIEDGIGRKAAIYSGNRLKETLGSLAQQKDRDYVRSHRLWLCQYGPHAVLPSGFKSWWLWQYTDGAINAGIKIPGINGAVDLNAYAGPREQLEKDWAS